jgi:glycosyltransferase involved in cell wall biosynthesis
MKPTRTILIVSPYFPPHGGGLERYALEISSRLAKDYNWRVISVSSTGDDDSREEISGITVYRLSYQFKISNTTFSFRWLSKIKKIIREEGVDVLNIHMPVPGIGDVASLACRDLPMVLTYHACSMVKGSFVLDKLICAYEKFVLKFVLDKAKNIICSSDSVRLDFLKKYTNKSTTVTPAVDSKFFKPNLNKKSNGKTIAFVAGLGRAEQHKGLQMLLNAIKISINKHPEINLLVAGDGDMRSEYEDRVKEMGLSENVKFLGRKNRDEIVNVYGKADIFVLPTVNDSFSMVILEAMSSGLPVVSVKTGSIPSLVKDGETGYLLDKNSTAEEFSEKINYFFENPEIAKGFGYAGRKFVEEYFCWDKQAEITNKIILNSMKQDSLVVQVSPYYPPHLGGLELVAQNIAENLAKRGRRILVLASSQKKWGDTEKRENIEIRRLGSFDFAHTPLSLGLIFHLLKLPKKSIIHFHLAQAYWLELTYFVARLKKIPYIIHFHGDVVSSGVLGKIYLLHKKYVQGPAMRNAEKVIVLSNEQIDFIEKTYGVNKEKIVYIPNGINEVFFSPIIRENIGEKINLLYAGRLSVQKRLDRLVEVMAQIDIPAKLTVVGDGEEREKIEKLIADKKIKNIELVGRKGPEELVQYCLKSDAFLLSSVFEGMPLVVMEAMATGLPIIATNVQGTRELVDGVGILVDEPYTENFVKAIKKVYEDKQYLKTLSNNSIEKSKSYTWSNSVDMVEKLYKEINHEKF